LTVTGERRQTTMPTDADDEAPSVPIVCEACETTTRVPISEVDEQLTKHNEQLHGGEPVAEVDPELKRHLTDLVADEILDEET
jgi:hypothetical protein